MARADGLVQLSVDQQHAHRGMRKGIGQQYRVTASQEQQRISSHSFAIVSKAMQENHGAAIEISGMHIPALEHTGIRGGNAYLLQLGVKLLAHQRFGLLAMTQRQMT